MKLDPAAGTHHRSISSSSGNQDRGETPQVAIEEASSGKGLLLYHYYSAPGRVGNMTEIYSSHLPDIDLDGQRAASKDSDGGSTRLQVKGSKDESPREATSVRRGDAEVRNK